MTTTARVSMRELAHVVDTRRRRISAANIGPKRFHPAGDETDVRLTHDQFANHGEGAEAYASEMASDLGWPYIMGRFRAFASRQAGR
jgi:hypothetical protein